MIYGNIQIKLGNIIPIVLIDHGFQWEFYAVNMKGQGIWPVFPAVDRDRGCICAVLKFDFHILLIVMGCGEIDGFQLIFFSVYHDRYRSGNPVSKIEKPIIQRFQKQI